ncbi:MAG TPA: NirD/YgiW/YdeI family stress tolerance protein [Spongiibacteraceae bacterium]|jgi:uncharacterized protein (TIGR00156 family)
MNVSRQQSKIELGKNKIVGAAVSAVLLAAALLLDGCASNPTPSNITIAEALAVPDDSKVVVTGQVVQQLDSEHYLLRDHSGQLTAEIDESLLGKVKIAPDARLRISGKIDQDHKPPLLEAKTVQLVQ